jgi:hypothetical protein
MAGIGRKGAEPTLPRRRYSNTSSARASSLAGTSRPRALGCSFYVFETGEQIERCSYFFIVS